MAQAWMVRSGQQQRLIEELIGNFYGEFERLLDAIHKSEVGNSLTAENEQTHRARFIEALLIQVIAGKEISLGERRNVYEKWSWVFWGKVESKIAKFSRAPEETKALGYRFLMQVARARQNDFEDALSQLELTQPQQIFHAPSSTAEIEIEEDGEKEE